MDRDNNNRAGALQRFNSYIPLASFYAVATGVLYLWGFWSEFKINILQYIDLLDLGKAAAFPLISAVGGLALSTLLQQFVWRPMLPPGAGAGTPIGVGLSKYKRAVFAIYLLVLLLVLTFVDDSAVKWFGFGAMASVPIAIALFKQGALRAVIEDDHMRLWFLGLMSTIFCLAFSGGRLEAVQIASGDDYFVVDQGSVAHVVGFRGSLVGELKYLGHAGEYLFILAPDSSVEILRADAVPALVIRRKRAAKPASTE